MPPSTRLLHAEAATATTPLLAADKRPPLSNGVARPPAENFEELAFRTLQALNPKRRIKRSEVPVERVRRLLERLLSGDSPAEVLSSLQLPNRRADSTASHSSSSSSPAQPNGTSKRASSPPPPLALVARKTSAALGSPALPPIDENSTGDSVDFDPQRRHSRLSAHLPPLSRRESIDEQSTSESTSDEAVEEPKPKTAFDLLFERALDEPTAVDSVRVILDELRQANTNESVLSQLRAQNLQNEIDPHRSAEKNVQGVEVKILLELHKISLLDEKPDLQQSKLIPALRYLNIITGGGAHLNEFVRTVLEPEFGSKLPVVFEHLRSRLGIEMPEPLKSFSPIDAADLPPAFAAPAEDAAAKERRESLEAAEERTSVARRRSNASTASVSTLSSVTSSMGLPTLDRFSAAATPLGSKRPSMADVAPVLVAEVPLPAAPRPKRSAQRKDSTATGSTEGNDVKPPRPATRSSAEEPPAPLKRAAKRKAAAALSKTADESENEEEEEEEEVVSNKRARRLGARGSIASRRQTNRRLCVIRQEVKDLILPTSRRSSTATLLQQQQPARRSLISRLTGQKEEPLLTSTAPKKSRFGSKESNDGRVKAEEAATKPKPPPDQPLTDEILQRYAHRMNTLYETAKGMDEHEVFYGRRNGRVDLFDTEAENSTGGASASPPECSSKPKLKPKATVEPTGTKKKPKSKKQKAVHSQQRKQKNRSGRSVKETSEDCLYIAHSLLNVHNRDPLASGRPRPSQLSNGALAFGGDSKRASVDGQPFRVKRLLRHANRAKVLKLKRYLQRAQEQQLLLQTKKEKVEVE